MYDRARQRIAKIRARPLQQQPQQHREQAQRQQRLEQENQGIHCLCSDGCAVLELLPMAADAAAASSALRAAPARTAVPTSASKPPACSTFNAASVVPPLEVTAARCSARVATPRAIAPLPWSVSVAS